MLGGQGDNSETAGVLLAVWESALMEHAELCCLIAGQMQAGREERSRIRARGGGERSRR